MWCSAWRALEDEDSEGKDKGLVRCRKMWQGTMCSHWSTTASEQDSAGTGLCIYALPSFCSKPHLPTSQRSGGDVPKGKRLTECPSHGAVGQPVLPSTHSSQLCAGLKDWILLCTFLVLLIFPAYSRSQWNFETEIELGLLCPSPLQEHWHAPHLVTKNPPNSGPQHRKCVFAHHVTTTLRSRLDKWSERKPDCAGRERKVNMVSVSSYTLPLILQSFCQREG